MTRQEFGRAVDELAPLLFIPERFVYEMHASTAATPNKGRLQSCLLTLQDELAAVLIAHGISRPIAIPFDTIVRVSDVYPNMGDAAERFDFWKVCASWALQMNVPRYGAALFDWAYGMAGMEGAA